MRGCIRKRPTRTKRNGKPVEQYYVVYDLPPQWDEERGCYRRRQKWERVEEPNTLKHAEELLAERLSQAHRGEYVQPSTETFREFTQRWVANYARAHLKEGTQADYSGYFKNHLLPAFGDQPLAHITVEDVQAFHAAKVAAGYAPQTIKHLLRILRQMLDHAVDWGYLRTNPARKVRNPRIPRREMDYLNADEVRRLLAAAPPQWYPFLLTAVTTGLRIGELLAMRWANLEWRTSRYFVKETLSRARYDFAGGFTSPKTEGSAQSVDLSPVCLQALRQHRHHQAEEKLEVGDGYEDQDLVFATRLGRPWDWHNVERRYFLPTLKEAQLRRIRFHDLRHTCATLLINQGASPKYVQRQLRHATVQITFDCYGHLFPEAGPEAMARMDEVLLAADGQERQAGTDSRVPRAHQDANRIACRVAHDG